MSINKRREKCIGCVVFVALVCSFFSYWPGALYAAGTGLAIENVQVDKTTLSPGEEVYISFRITEDSRVTILIYDPDYAVVRKLINRQTRYAGTITEVWGGRDDSGAMVPDEAYLVVIIAETDDGRRAIYDPTSFSGGEQLSIFIDEFEKVDGKYNIHYSLQYPSRISIRAGVHNGPLLITILDWKPLPTGDYIQTWDGMDDTGQIEVMEEPGSIVYIRGFLLPENTIIVQGSSGNYQAYHRNIKSKSSGKNDILSYQSIREKILSRRGKRISHYYLVRKILNVAPKFTVYLGRDKSHTLAESAIPDVSGEVDFTVEVDPESLYSFNESRYEIVVFIDNNRFDEEEQAYSPYTYTLDTTRLTNGEHWISINLASITGQVGSYSFRINVNN